ncbi:rod shape-determining protein MreC [Oceanobacillus piezotolerans]|uniref:Cell shape-determining protein MreC n=1 Tax=Oceanobacillus piezotolerans TaxID=2448030 RepID=A0A498DAF5_9BACI|nr:rod shape-determining protein MreC [Oceanobacillus piezotolerans]RLL47961.1 rod shape-determining protein MreC [Oceanobacillus piezotolerans]
MSFFRNKRLLVFLIGFIVVVVLIGYSLGERDKLSTAEQLVNDTVGWVQSVINMPVGFVTNIYTNMNEFLNIYEENQILKEQLAGYKGLIYEVQELRDENQTLRDNLELTNSMRDYEPIQANVISRSPELWLEEVTIDTGTQDGVQKNMVVVTGEGMIGKIKTANQFTSKVQLLTGFDQFNRISAMISKEEGHDIFGMIEGFDKESNSLMFRIIEESEEDIGEGELVVSSGMGGVFPAGLIIGTVKEVVPDQYGLTRTALVEPAADVYDINQVMVLDRSLDVVDEDAEEEEVKEE